MQKTPINKLNKSKLDNSFQIIAGDYHKKKFKFIGDKTLRPTAGRIRETLFNWLQFDIAGKTVLDVFAGSGALGFEALSRGAKSVVLVEKNPQTAEQLQQNIQELNNSKISVINADIFQTQINKTFDIIFLDPPFGKDLIPKTLDFLLANNLINNNTLIYLESEKPQTHSKFKTLKQKQTKNVFYCLIKINEVLKG